jgi:carbon-monoxide dehydrogenase iron sulfur subunit
MLLDVSPEKCTGCRTCEVFCSIAHEGQAFPELSRIKVWKVETRNIFLPIVCPPCNDKPCMSACPEEGAMRLREDGAVIVEESLCTGCCMCIRACSLGAITFHRLEGRGKHGKAVVLKCDLCDGDPWCVRVCEPGAVAIVKASPSASRSVFTRLAELLRLAEADLAERGFPAKQEHK